MIFRQKVGNLRLILGKDLFFFFLEITMIFRQKVGNLRLILGEDLFFRDQCDFFGDQSQNGPGLKNVGHP